MRKLIAGFAASLDGYIEGPNGEYDWILIDKEMDFAAQMARFDAFLFGRKTYEMVLPMGGKKQPGVTNYVFSNTLTQVAADYTLVQGGIEQRVHDLKQQPGRDMAVFGGASLLASLLHLKLVDEIEVAVVPVLLGTGKPMVAALREQVWLRFLTSRTYGNGTVQLIYKVIYDKP